MALLKFDSLHTWLTTIGYFLNHIQCYNLSRVTWFYKTANTIDIYLKNTNLSCINYINKNSNNLKNIIFIIYFNYKKIFYTI